MSFRFGIGIEIEHAGIIVLFDFETDQTTFVYVIDWLRNRQMFTVWLLALKLL